MNIYAQITNTEPVHTKRYRYARMILMAQARSARRSKERFSRAEHHLPVYVQPRSKEKKNIFLSLTAFLP